MMAAKTVFWRGTRNIRDLGAGRGKKSQSNDPASKPEWALAAIGRYLLDKNATRVAIVLMPCGGAGGYRRELGGGSL